MATKKGGIIYVLENKKMPHLFKIGMTTGNLEKRVKELSSPTGVPESFNVRYAWKVANPAKVEKCLQKVFGYCRSNKGREFFEIKSKKAAPTLSQILSILSLIRTKDITPGNHEEGKSSGKPRNRKANFNFHKVGIPVGATLSFRDDRRIKATVADERHIKFGKKGEISLSKAAREIYASKGKELTAICGPNVWLYKGEILSEIRSRLES